MQVNEFVRLTSGSFLAYRARSALTTLGIAIGIAAVVLLTSIGAGIQQFVLAQFTQFGTHLIAINPGKTMTTGGPIGVFGTTRPLTIDDAEALRRSPYIDGIVSAVQGNAEVKAGKKSRRTTVYGVDAGFPKVFSMLISSGKFLPADDPRAARAFAVLGYKAKQELFGDANALGERIRVGGDRYRVIGVMESKGQVLGVDLDDSVYIPTGRALDLFNREGLMEIDTLYRRDSDVDEVLKDIKRILIARHGREDFTITTQQQMLDVLGSVLNVLTFAVAALGSISLIVGGVGIFTIMTIAVSERTGEIGLFRAIGATRRQIVMLFLGEAIILAAAGGVMGLVLGIAGAQLLHAAVPALPVHTPWSYVMMAEALAISIGLIAGVWPARRAAMLNPVEALRAE